MDAVVGGSGSGYGDGSGYGYGEYWKACLASFVGKLDSPSRALASSLQSAGAKLAFWWSDKTGAPSNGGRDVAAKPRAVHTASGPLTLCHAGTLHATLLPPRWKGERLWIVALKGEVIGDDEKMGCLERVIIGECI